MRRKPRPPCFMSVTLFIIRDDTAHDQHNHPRPKSLLHLACKESIININCAANSERLHVFPSVQAMRVGGHGSQDQAVVKYCLVVKACQGTCRHSGGDVMRIDMQDFTNITIMVLQRSGAVKGSTRRHLDLEGSGATLVKASGTRRFISAERDGSD